MDCNTVTVFGASGRQAFRFQFDHVAPDEPCGQSMYDLILTIKNIFAGIGLALAIFRPTVFMDNWLASFAKRLLVKELKYRYSHKPDLQFIPICLAR